MFALVACNPLPEVRYETKRLQIAPDFDHPICAGTLAMLDQHVEQVERALAKAPSSVPMRFYWMSDGVQEWCASSDTGCFFPGTRVLLGNSHSVKHEIVHATMDAIGDSYFVEEGLAEVFAGLGIMRRERLAGLELRESLRISRDRYRDGHLDYLAAAHFMRWYHETAGRDATIRLARTIEDRAAPERVEAVLESTLGRDMDEIVAEYSARSPTYYRGYSRALVPDLEIDVLYHEHTIVLDCDKEHTLGPLWDEQPGMYRVHAVDLPQSMALWLKAEGDGDTWIDVIHPERDIHGAIIEDWTLPDPSVDADAVRVSPGQSATLLLDAGPSLLIVASRSLAPRKLRLVADEIVPGP